MDVERYNLHHLDEKEPGEVNPLGSVGAESADNVSEGVGYVVGEERSEVGSG